MEWMVTWKNDVVGWREGVGKMSEASYIIVLFFCVLNVSFRFVRRCIVLYRNFCVLCYCVLLCFMLVYPMLLYCILLCCML